MPLDRKAVGVLALAALPWLGLPACAETERPPRMEDVPRAMAPVPACILPLAGKPRAAGTLRNLHEEEYWKLVFPSYDASHHQLDPAAAACTGSAVFDDPVFRGGSTRGTPIQVEDGDILYGNGGDHMRIVWMRTHRWKDGSEAGPIALVRALDDFAEVYAVGVFKRAASQSSFQAERLGEEFLVSATDDGCEGLPPTRECDAKVTLLLPRFGRLVEVAAIDTEKRAYATGSEPGVQGAIEYRLTTSPQYTSAGVKLFEEVQATDSAGRVVRSTELERMLVLRDGKMEPTSDGIWDRVYPRPAR
ncbi:MAG TPA: hypothetical protein VF765_02145 [Polyangiaceae bacterium]